MKRFLALAALVLGLAACQTEPEGLDVIVGGEVETTVCVSLPETTRANSANGFDLRSLNSTDYSLRYILEVYRVNDDAVLYDTCQRFVETSKNTSMVFPVRLAPGYDYRIVAWTDIVEGDSKEDRYYYTEEGLDNVVIKDNGTVNWNAMDETRDAYTYVKVVDNFSSASNLDMTLTRPFAKLRVVATDIDDIRRVGLVPTTATVEYSQDMYFKYNAVADIENKGAANDARAKSHRFTYTTTTSQYVDNDGEYTLFTDYIFVPSTGTAKFNLTVKDADGNIINKEIGSFNTEIFVERNKLTTIKGDVLTIGGNVKVEVDNGLREINYADSAETLQEIINEAPVGEQTNITLGGDIDLGDLFGASISSTRAAATLPIVIAEDKVVVLNLNGHKITTPFVEGSTTNHAYAFENHGSLTIQDSKGNGQIIARGIFNYGTLTLESGTINACDGNGGYGVRNYDGEFLMNGGAVITSYEDGDDRVSGNYDATPIRVDEGATATITNGTITNICNYTSAIENHGTTTIDGGSFTSVHSTVTNYGTMTINGPETTIKCDGEYTSAHPIYTYGESSTTYINGGNIIANDKSSCYYVSVNNSTVYISGGEFTNAGQAAFTGEGTIVVTGGQFDKDPSARVADGYKADEANGVWTVTVDPVAKIGETEYNTLEDAIAAAKAGDTITLLRDITLAAELGLPAGIIFNGNGKQINGSIYAGGDLTFVGHTKVTAFSASYYNRVITIGEGACLEVTGTGRVSLAYGNTFNITGSIQDAKSADKANIQPSLIIPGGISITGGSDATMNVTNAYVQIGDTSSKNNAADGEFKLNFKNSIAEFTNQFTFAAPTSGKNPTFIMNIEDSVFTTDTKLCIAAPNSVVNVNNSVVTLGSNLRNSGELNLTNGSVLTGKTIQFGENGGNNGTINVDNSSFTIIAGSTGHAFDGKGIGSINATKGATVNVDYYQDMTINVDETSTFTGTDRYANRKIYYTGYEELVPTTPEAINATIVSNSSVYDSKTGKGVITFDNDVTTIGAEAFYRTDRDTPSNWMTSITLPESVKTIGNKAFYQCFSLTTINIPDSVETIGEYAFSSCNAVTSVTIGSKVANIASGAFYASYAIEEIICKPTTPPTLADKWVFYEVEPKRVVVPAASVDAYKAAWSMFADKIVAGEF